MIRTIIATLCDIVLLMVFVVGGFIALHVVVNNARMANAFTQFTQQLQQNTLQSPIVQQQMGTSLNWAGYAATGGQFTQVSGSWVVPTVAATPKNSVDATWVGIGGIASQDLIQAGTQANVSRTGTITYQAWYEVLPRTAVPVAINVTAGDHITTTIAQQSPNNWQISIVDTTNGQSMTKQIAYTSSLSSAEWVEEALSSISGQELALDNFGSVSFSGASAVHDGTNSNLSQLHAQPITMVTQTSQPLATTSEIGNDGASFTVTRQAGVSSGTITPGVRRQYRIPVTRVLFRRHPYTIRQFVIRW